VTGVSGRYGWDGSFRARIWQFDANGELEGAEPTIRAYEGIQVDVTVPSDGLAIVERVR